LKFLGRLLRRRHETGPAHPPTAWPCIP
jgi:hypothetical protein